jgi:hypothetical protein
MKRKDRRKRRKTRPKIVIVIFPKRRKPKKA